MKSAPRYHHGDLRAALLDATVAVVRKLGPEAVTLREVARRAGVSEAAPYHHFANKADLLAAAAARGYLALGERFGAAVAGTSTAAQRLVELGVAYVGFAIDEPGYFRLMFGAHIAELTQHSTPAIEGTKAAGRAAASALRTAVADFVRESGSSQDAMMFERVYWAEVHGVAWLVIEQELRPQPTRAEATALAREGVELLVAGAIARARTAGSARPRSAARPRRLRA